METVPKTKSRPNASIIVSSTITTFAVQLHCEGCKVASSRALEQVPGVSKVDAKMDEQKIYVTHDSQANPQVLLAALQKWGQLENRKVELLG